MRCRPSGRLAGALMALLLVGLVVSQVLFIRSIGNGVSRFGDPYSEANAFRAAEFYATFGFLVDAGLPHIVYGAQFPGVGWVTDLYRYPLPRGVYTRYPPLPDIICGILERVVGREYRWAWRILPVAVGLLALALVFGLLRGAMGPLPAAWLAVSVGVAPLTWTFLHGLHFEGYAHALAIVQIALVASILLSARGPSRAEGLTLFGMALCQGFLSFEYCFVVCLMVVPMYFVARADGGRPDWSSVLVVGALSATGFIVAHGFHFVQVAVFYGSVQEGVRDLASRARFRSTGGLGAPFPHSLLAGAALLEYTKVLFLTAANSHFSVLMPLLVVAAGSLPFLGRTRRTEPQVRDLCLAESSKSRFRWNSVAGAIGSALAISASWLVVMPTHSIVHLHIVPRIFVLPYMTCGLLLALWVFRTVVQVKTRRQ
jgi:hypothetical protein